MERVHHEVSTVSQIVEDLGLEDEVAAVDTEARLPDVLDAGHLAAVARRDEVVAQLRRHAQEARDVVVAPEMLELRGQRQVRQPVAVVGKELTLPREVALHRQQPLADTRVRSRVHERDAPVANVAPQQLDLAPSLRQHEVVGVALVVVAEIVLDDVAAVPQTQDEVLVSEVRVVLHHVPQDGTVTDGHDRLRDMLVVVPEPCPQPTAEQNDLHRCARCWFGYSQGGAFLIPNPPSGGATPESAGVARVPHSITRAPGSPTSVSPRSARARRHARRS